MNNYTPSDKIIAFTKSWEKCILHPYPDATGTWTIGHGNTFYEDGTPVKATDSAILQDRADSLFNFVYNKFGKDVLGLLKVQISQNQYDALCDFDYNKGTARLSTSTLLRVINKNPNDASITSHFLEWNKSNGVVLKGLVERAKDNADIYVKGIYVNHK